jgi:sterol desaturase/sphingolipid hydroxylase (fatty acid hydroxylase superfamily)
MDLSPALSTSIRSLSMFDQISTRIISMLPAIGQSLLISFTILTTWFLFEIALIGWRESSARKALGGGGSIWTDCISALLVLTNLALIIGTLLSFGLIYFLQRWFKDHASINLLAEVPIPWLAYLIFIVAIDFSNYWSHRLMHRVGPLWELHKFHHTAEQMTMLTALRDHPMERAVGHGFNAIPAALLGLPAEQYIVIQLGLQSLGFVKHSNIHSSWGWVGKWLIQSPSAHRIHHSKALEHHNTNFASIFQFWDVLFGTAIHPSQKTSRRAEIGLAPRLGSDRPLYLLARTTKDFYGSIFTCLKRRRT